MTKHCCCCVAVVCIYICYICRGLINLKYFDGIKECFYIRVMNFFFLSGIIEADEESHDTKEFQKKLGCPLENRGFSRSPRFKKKERNFQV